jgi:pimeloyl-ACP methyl ester carboxylesterase
MGADLMFSSYALGRYFAAEGDVVLHPRDYGRDGTRRGVVFAHGSGQSGLSSAVAGWHRDQARALGARFPTVAADLGGANTFGNDTFISRVSTAKTYLEGIGAKADGIILVGASMGTTICNWARQHLADVKAMLLLIGPPDFEDARATNRQSLQAPIEAAYTNNAGWQAARPTHNPIEFADELASLPLLCVRQTEDTVVFPEEVEDFATAAGAELISVPGDHGVGPMPTEEYMDWLKEYA